LGLDRVAKRLNRFLVAGELVDRMGQFTCWNSLDYISDHLPISLQIDFDYKRLNYPLKFNRIWQEDKEFRLVVEAYWNNFENGDSNYPWITFYSKLTGIKRRVIYWIKEKKKYHQQELKAIDGMIYVLLDKAYRGPYEMEDRDKLAGLTYRKDHLLKLQETTWRLKSRALWLEAGDHNTKFFHSYASQRHVNNTIWELENCRGRRLSIGLIWRWQLGDISLIFTRGYRLI